MYQFDVLSLLPLQTPEDSRSFGSHNTFMRAPPDAA